MFLSRRNAIHATLAGAGILALFVPRIRVAAATSKIVQPQNSGPDAFIQRAFEMRDLAKDTGDQPYGAIIVNPDGVIVGQAPSRVIVNHDPTAHAEMEAIRDAAGRLGTKNLSAHVMYSSSRPCPMCEGGAYWAGLEDMIFGELGERAGPPHLCR